MSFVDPDKPEGSRFIGVSIVEAPHFIVAHTAAWERGCNPGGEVLINEIPLGMLSAETIALVLANTHRLMDYAELKRLGFDPDSEEWSTDLP